MILHIDGVDQEVLYCQTCFALVFEADYSDHYAWHQKLQQWFELITANTGICVTGGPI